MLVQYYPLILDGKQPPDYLVKLLHQAKISGRPRDLDHFKGKLFKTLYPLLIIIAHAEAPNNHESVDYRILSRLMTLNYLSQKFRKDIDLLKFIDDKLKR